MRPLRRVHRSLPRRVKAVKKSRYLSGPLRGKSGEFQELIFNLERSLLVYSSRAAYPRGEVGSIGVLFVFGVAHSLESTFAILSVSPSRRLSSLPMDISGFLIKQTIGIIIPAYVSANQSSDQSRRVVKAMSIISSLCFSKMFSQDFFKILPRSVTFAQTTKVKRYDVHGSCTSHSKFNIPDQLISANRIHSKHTQLFHLINPDCSFPNVWEFSRWTDLTD